MMSFRRRLLSLFGLWLAAGIAFGVFADIYLENGADDNVRLACFFKGPALAAEGFSFFEPPPYHSDVESYYNALMGLLVLTAAFLVIPGTKPALLILFFHGLFAAYGLVTHASVIQWWNTHGHG